MALEVFCNNAYIIMVCIEVYFLNIIYYVSEDHISLSLISKIIQVGYL